MGMVLQPLIVSGCRVGHVARSTEATEARNLFLLYVAKMVSFWEREERQPDMRGKLEGLAFSILAAVDGAAEGLPAYDLTPDDIAGGRRFSISGSLHDDIRDYLELVKRF